MKFYKRIFYNIRHVIPTIGMAGATMLPTSCAKTEVFEPVHEVPIQQHDVEIEFDSNNGDKILTFDSLRKHIDDKTVRTIYLVPTQHWDGCSAANITYFRKNFLQQRLAMSSKITGRGDFDFKLGEASKVPEDSLWFVKNGWTINKYYR